MRKNLIKKEDRELIMSCSYASLAEYFIASQNNVGCIIALITVVILTSTDVFCWWFPFLTHDLKIGVNCYSDVDLVDMENENAIFHFDNIKLLYIFSN